MEAELKDLTVVGGDEGETAAAGDEGETTAAGEDSPHEDATKSAKDERPLLASSSSLPAAPSSSGETIEELDEKHAPYARRDAYGTMGRGEIPLAEKALLFVAAITLLPIRLVAGILLLLVYYVICRLCTMFSPPYREEEQGQEDYAHITGWRRVAIVRSGRFLSRLMLFTVGFYWISEKRFYYGEREECDEHDKPGVIVSNHVSYLDILYHMSSSFPSFVAKRSVAKLPLIGIISKCLGCVYVQRELKSLDFKGVSGIVTERIREAHQNKHAPIMMLFPEGTTTNGNYLLPFKSGAFLAKVPIRPVILRYPYQRFSPAWDSISGVRHILLLLCQFVNHLEVIHMPVYCPLEQEKEDSKLYANNVRKLMGIEGNLTLSDIGLAEKRVYHAALNGNSLSRSLHPKDE